MHSIHHITRRRGPLRVAAVLSVLAMFLAGCGLTANPSKAAPEQWVEEPGVSAKAQELYSTPDIESAYAAITTFALQRGLTPS